MARKAAKTVYERIEDKKEEIKSTEEHLKELKDNLNLLIEEKDDLEMRNLFAYARSNNISLEDIQNAFSNSKQSKK